jgi:hypothetical protein
LRPETEALALPVSPTPWPGLFIPDYVGRTAMTPLDYYRQRAAECHLLAEEMPDSNERDILHLLAAGWIRLAERAETKTS